MMKRISKKQYIINKMIKHKLIAKGMNTIMKEHFSTDEVQKYYENITKTNYGKKQLKKVI